MMTATPRNAIEAYGPLGLPMDYVGAHWYVASTCANHERRVQQQLEVRNVETFLPLYASVRRWKDRRVHLHLPLFPGYVFVRIALRDRLRVLQIPGAVRLVGFNGHPTALPTEEIEAIRRGLTHVQCVEPYPYLRAGRRVRINSGPLAGLEGILLRKKNPLRVVLSVDLIMRSVVAEVDVSDLDISQS
jgi:transcription antitermination factor NusG